MPPSHFFTASRFKPPTKTLFIQSGHSDSAFDWLFGNFFVGCRGGVGLLPLFALIKFPSHTLIKFRSNPTKPSPQCIHTPIIPYDPRCPSHNRIPLFRPPLSPYHHHHPNHPQGVPSHLPVRPPLPNSLPPYHHHHPPYPSGFPPHLLFRPPPS